VTGTAALAFDGHPTAAAAVAAVAVALSCSSLRFAALGKSRWPRLPASVKATALVVLVTAAALRVSWPDGRGGVPTGLDLAALATAVATAIHLRRAAAAGDSAPETPSGAA